MITIQTALQKIIQKTDLTSDEMTVIMQQIMQGELTSAQLGAFLIAMRMKGETVTEITAAAKVMREIMTSVAIAEKNQVDIVGTGGDQAHTFNISTASTFVVAAAGGYVAKVGNRSVSSSSGSADVLEAAGVNLNLTPLQIAACVKKIGVGFMFAPSHHNAMKHAIPVRKELGVRTFFNLLGPLTNPANTQHQLIGVFAKEWVIPIAQVLQQLGSKHVLVVHSDDGLDEISIAAPTFVAELKSDKITTYTLTPEQFGFPRATLDELKVTTVEQSLTMLKQVLAYQHQTGCNIVALNAGAAIYVAGITKNITEGVTLAKELLTNGNALEKFNALINLTQQFS